jgi:hypothetical protein
MTRFRELLKPGLQTTPMDEQDRASKMLAGAVGASNLSWWKKRETVPGQGKYLLLAVAPYSQYDLIFLDLIDEYLGSKPAPSVQIHVANLQDYDDLEQLQADFPGIPHVHQTPVAALWEPGSQTKTAWGKNAREMIAEVLGLDAADLQRRIVAESPRYPTLVSQ